MADEHNEVVEETEIRDGEEYWSEETLLTTLKQKVTERGFGLWEFTDRSQSKCSLQDSSLATEPAIWFGVDDPRPQIMASKTAKGGVGWVEYPLPEDVHMFTRMQLTQQQVKALLPILTYFAETGEYVRDYKKPTEEPTEEPTDE
jgi:hypothetical protein